MRQSDGRNERGLIESRKPGVQSWGGKDRRPLAAFACRRAFSSRTNPRPVKYCSTPTLLPEGKEREAMRFVRFCLPGLLLGVAWSGIATVAQTATAPSSARAANSASENADHDLEVLPLWPGKPPGTDNWNAREKVFVSKDGTRFIQNVTLPTLTVFPPQGKANGTAVVICPGGAYHFLAIDYEGNDVARWLSSLGVTAFVLKYRVYPTGEDPLNEVHALMAGKPEFREHLRIAMPVADEDGRQAVRIVRQRAGKWGIDPNRIMLMGFSAGGGLTVDVALKHRR